MVLDMENKERDSSVDKGFFAYIGEIRNNFKNFISSVFSVKKDSSEKLNNLKNDVSYDSTRENHNQVADLGNNVNVNNSDENTNSDLKSESVGDSVENDNKNLKDKLKEICVRSRTYWEVNKNDVWFVSFWKLQFHGDKSKKIMHNIKSADPSRFASIMTDPLFKNIDVACTSVRNDNQAKQFKKLMEDPKAQQEMDKVVDETIAGYLEFVKGLWVSDARATLAFWRICNFWIWHAKKVKNNMVKAGANINDYSQVIDYYEKSVSWAVRTKFQKKYSYFWDKNLREFIGEYKA